MKCDKCQWNGYNSEKYTIKECRDKLAEQVRQLKNKIKRQQRKLQSFIDRII